MQFWDQPTRGLDSKAALEFAKMLRSDADRDSKAIVLTTYQAGNGIFDQFDKVIVLAAGRVIYYGPRASAKTYFEELGFVCPKGANIADFLTSVTVQTERVISPDYEGKPPSTAEEFESVYARSDICHLMSGAIQHPESMVGQVEELKLAVATEKKHRKLGIGKRSVYTAGLREQVINCTIRYVQTTPQLTHATNCKANSK